MGSKSNGAKNKSVSWYASGYPDEEFLQSDDDKYIDPLVQHKLKSKSLEVKHDSVSPRSTNSNIPKHFCAGLPLPAIAVNVIKDSMNIIERTLTMRQSETRVYKFNTRLIESIPGGDIAYMKRMLVMGANVNATCRMSHVSACHIAALYDNDALEWLLKCGAESLRSDRLGKTPLHLAAWAGNINQIALLLDFPEAIRKSLEEALTPDTLEVVRKHSSTVHKLTNIQCEFNVESTLEDGWSDGMEHNCRNLKNMLPKFRQGDTALHAASARAHHQCVQLLLAAGADPLAQNIYHRTPLDVAGSAYYIGHDVDVANFEKTVSILLEAGSKFQTRSQTNNLLNTPMHTAVELGSEKAIEDLLEAGASTTIWNREGLTPMHVAIKKRNKELLQLLAFYEYKNEDPFMSAVDVKDLKGYTVLGAAVREGWIQGVYIALGAGASITMKINGESSIHIAAELGNEDILRELLDVAKLNSAIDFRNEKGETALFKAISHGQLGAVKLLLEVGANIEVEIGKTNVFHVAAEKGNKAILEYLLEYDSVITNKIIHQYDNNLRPPLLYAVFNDHPVCVELLKSKGAHVNCFVPDPNNTIKETVIQRGAWTTPLHIAASKNYCEIAEIIIKHDRSTIQAEDTNNHVPLHNACYHGNREMIVLLLKYGADLSADNENSKSRLSPIAMLMNNLSKPTEFMQNVFDSYISSQGVTLQESKCEVKVDYRILVPNESDSKHMNVIKALINTGNSRDQNKLLLHPLVQSFVYLQWRVFLPFFYSILALHLCFVICLNVYTGSVFYFKDKRKTVPCFLQPDVWEYIIHLTICLIAIQEIIFMRIKKKKYLLCLETWLKFGAIALALILTRIVSWETEHQEWVRIVAILALLLSGFEIMFLLSRFPDWGHYFLMFGKVASKVFKILLSFMFLIYGFSICFMIQFHAQEPFEGPWASFVKIIVMMTSEYDYQSTISKDSALKISASIITLRIIFMTFLVLVSIILMNLLVGVAVNDVNNLEVMGNIKRLQKQVEMITSVEDIVCHKFFRNILRKKVKDKGWLGNKKWENVLVLRPREEMCSNCIRLPARIREAIFEKAYLQKKQSDEEMGSKIFKMKLDEVHKIIVRDSSKQIPEKLDAMVNNIYEEINKIRTDVDVIKQFVAANKRRTLSSTKSFFL